MTKATKTIRYSDDQDEASSTIDFRKVDDYVGKRIRARRTYLDLTQEGLARALGITFQQIQKYEQASNRISAGRLYYLSRALKVPINYFFERVEEALNPGLREPEHSLLEEDPYFMKETAELLRAYYQIANPTVRRKFLELVQSVCLNSSAPKTPFYDT